MARRGPRPHGDARADILAAARSSFAAHGYDRTSLRGIARDAGVDPALVHHYFDGKAALFAATMELPVRPGEVVAGILAGPRDTVGERLARGFLAVWDGPGMADRARALVSAQVSAEAGFAPLRGFLLTEVFGRLARELDAGEPQRRAALVGSQLVGVLLTRYVVELPGMVDAPADRLVADLAPTLQRYLLGPLPADPGEPAAAGSPGGYAGPSERE